MMFNWFKKKLKEDLSIRPEIELVIDNLSSKPLDWEIRNKYSGSIFLWHKITGIHVALHTFFRQGDKFEEGYFMNPEGPVKFTRGELNLFEKVLKEVKEGNQKVAERKQLAEVKRRMTNVAI